MSGGDAADEPGPFHCHECDARTWNEPDMHAYCDACRTDHMEEARATAHAAGYAEAVADVREWIRKTFSGDVVRLLGADIDAGAHVGAAKKGGSQ